MTRGRGVFVRGVIAVAAVSLVAGAALLAGENPDPRAVSPAPGTGGDGFQPYDEPRRLTPGTFPNRIFGPSKVEGAEERGIEASDAEDRRPKFEGWYEGLYIVGGYDPPPDDPSLRTCEGPAEVAAATEVEESPLAIELPDYLPPGTFEVAPQHGVRCDGRVSSVTRDFTFSFMGASLDIHRRYGYVVYGRASEGRLRTEQVDDSTFVVIDPLTPEGYGQSVVVVREEWGGITLLEAVDVPIGEVLKIARSM